MRVVVQPGYCAWIAKCPEMGKTVRADTRDEAVAKFREEWESETGEVFHKNFIVVDAELELDDRRQF